MKLKSLNKALSKYTTAKAGLNKPLATSDNNKTDMPERSGNQTVSLNTDSKLTNDDYTKNQATSDNHAV
jgi:hypothetical protein